METQHHTLTTSGHWRDITAPECVCQYTIVPKMGFPPLLVDRIILGLVFCRILFCWSLVCECVVRVVSGEELDIIP